MTPSPGTTTRFACRLLLLAAAACTSLLTPASAQSGRRDARAARPTPTPAPAPVLLKRTTSRRESHRFPYGGRVTLYGAPQGSLTIEAWPKAEVEIEADVELSAPTEEDLARLAAVNTFAVDDDVNHLTLLTVGTHDRKYMKRTAKDFPKRLLGLPWRVDYRVRVPQQTDLEIYAGRGALTLRGVEGAIKISGGEADPATLALAGGDLDAILQGGPVNIDVTTRSWRGHGLSLRLARGDVRLSLPAGFNGYVNADVQHAGRVENAHPGLAPVERTRPTERSLQGVAGAGGATISLTVVDGTIRIQQSVVGSQ